MSRFSGPRAARHASEANAETGPSTTAFGAIEFGLVDFGPGTAFLATVSRGAGCRQVEARVAQAVTVVSGKGSKGHRHPVLDTLRAARGSFVPHDRCGVAD